jgi:ribosomal protein S18 acetylase RimI-like enzyme
MELIENGGHHVKALKIRRFEKEDAAALSDLIRRNFMEVNIKDYPIEEMMRLSEYYCPDKILEISAYAHMYTACIDEIIVGCGAITDDHDNPGESSLQTIFVLPEFHGKGIGRGIITALEKDEFSLQANKIKLSASVTACEFYRKLGYDYKEGIKILDEDGLYPLEKSR